MCNNHNDTKSTQPAKNKRHGSALEHGQAHEQDHQAWSRRSFLRNMGIAGSASMILGNLPLTAYANAPFKMAFTNNEAGHILVLIRLKGGNDGLNTIVPMYDYDNYRNLRPTIGLQESQLISLSDNFAMPNSLANIQPMWEEGSMKVINSVGYPDQNLSHFRSSDIWASASDANVLDTSGWMGRYLESLYPDFINEPPAIPPAIQIGGIGNLAFNNSENQSMSVVVSDPDQLAQIAQNGEFYDTNNLPDCYYGEQVGFMRSIANSTFKYAEVIAEAYNASTNAVDYQFPLGQQLAVVSRLIKGNLGTCIYLVEVDGFDTHAGQNNTHPYLMNQIATGVRDFFQDLGAGGRAQDVICMTYSEFGRRIEQNASQGTDHGAAAPMMLFGSGLNGSDILGQNPDLNDTDQVGNLKYGTDFRQVYATLLENWLCVDAQTVDEVLGDSFIRMPEIGVECSATSTTSTPAPSIQHKAFYQDGQLVVSYKLSESAPVQIQLFNVLGQPVAQLFNGRVQSGSHQVSYPLRSGGFTAGVYVYSIRVGSRVYSQKISMFR